MCQLVEVVVDTLQCHHCLMAIVDGQCLILHALRSNIHLWQFADLRQLWVVSSYHFAFDRCHLQLRVKRCEERGHQVVEAIEHAQRHH